MRKNCSSMIKAAAMLIAYVSLITAQVTVTEIHYHPLAEGTVDGDEYEFIELKNTGSSTVSLDGYAFTTGIHYSFPSGSQIGAGEFIVLAWNSDRFKQRYGVAPFGVFTGHLDNKGEKVVLTGNGKEVFSVSYGTVSPWPEAADGAGFSLVVSNADGATDPDDPSRWRTSSAVNGNPGKDDKPGDLKSLEVKVNEALTHTDLPQKDAIELYNPTTKEVDISGWYLTDEKDEPLKYRIPDGTIIKAQSYLVFDSDDFDAGSTAFSLNAHDDGAYLFSTDTSGNLTGLCHGFKYAEAANGVSFGRVENSSGEEFFVSMQDLTLGSENGEPLVGPLVISEINYDGPDGIEFLEIVNISESSIPMYDPERPINTWKVEGIAFSFPQNITIKPGEAIILFSDTVSAAVFRNTYKIAESVRLFPFSGNISDNGEEIRLEMPCEPYVDGAESIVPYMVIDIVKYGTESPWPQVSGGNSIERKKLNLFGCEALNWKKAAPSPGNSLSVGKGGRFGDNSLSRMEFSSKDASVCFISSVSGPLEILTYDLSGRCIYKCSREAVRGINRAFSGIPVNRSGIYITQLRTSGENVTGKFLIR
ncbi:MAG: hypothetical protein GX556_00100 [Fibrobacter sp.]|nr:hypothetical protein [Fibrobacter sp.]